MRRAVEKSSAHYQFSAETSRRNSSRNDSRILDCQHRKSLSAQTVKLPQSANQIKQSRFMTRKVDARCGSYHSRRVRKPKTQVSPLARMQLLLLLPKRVNQFVFKRPSPDASDTASTRGLAKDRN